MDGVESTMWRSMKEIRRSLPGPPYVVADGDVPDLVRLARDSGKNIIHVDMPETPTRRTVLEALGRALDFPDWFGANWDAWDDTLGDFTQGSRDSTVVFGKHSERLLAVSPELFAEIVYSLRSAQDMVAGLQSEMLLEFIFAGRWDSPGIAPSSP